RGAAQPDAAAVAEDSVAEAARGAARSAAPPCALRGAFPALPAARFGELPDDPDGAPFREAFRESPGDPAGEPSPEAPLPEPSDGSPEAALAASPPCAPPLAPVAPPAPADRTLCPPAGRRRKPAPKP